MPNPRPYQTEDVQSVIESHKEHQAVLGRGATGCHAKGQKLIRFDGFLIPVEDVKVGDLLMGPDSLPRKVISLCRGRGQMVRVTPTKGDSWIVNEDHILTLVRTRRRAGDRRSGEVIDIPVNEWEKWSRFRKHVSKLFRVSVEFSDNLILPLDPYFLGILIGDGTIGKSLTLTANDDEIHAEAQRQAESREIFIRESFNSSNARTSHFTTGRTGNRYMPIQRLLEGLGFGFGPKWHCGAAEKFIPHSYKTASRANRLELLAGLIDTDGSYFGGCFDYISKSEQLANDVAFVARSLGFAAYTTPCVKSCQTGASGTYFRVCISGDLSQVPTRIARKQATNRQQKKDHLRTGFRVERIGEDDYYGFTLTGDGRYLLDDFTVTHNTGKAVTLAILAGHYSKFGRVMVMVDMRRLVFQLAETIEWFTGIKPGIEMAEFRATNHGLHGSDQIVASSVQTQYYGESGSERYREFNPAEFSACLLDECELFLAPEARAVVDWYASNPKCKIVGVTATPLRGDGLAMANLFTALAFDRDINWGIANGWLVEPKQAFVRVSIDFSTLTVSQQEDGGSDYGDKEIAGQLLASEQSLIELAKGIVHVCGVGRTIVACPTVEAAKAIAHYIEAEKPGQARAIYGQLTDAEKDQIFASHRSGDFQFLVSVLMICKGYDDPEVVNVVNCRKTRSKRFYQQLLGRGTRPLKGLLDELNDATPEQRRQAIATSRKPSMLMVNMVGVDAETRDITIIDILGEAQPEAVRDRAKLLELEEELSTEDAIARAAVEIAAESESLSFAAEVAADALQEKDDEDAYGNIRRRVNVAATVDVEYSDDLRVGGGEQQTTGIETRHLSILQKNKVPEKTIARLTPQQAKELSRKIISRHQAGLASFAQSSLLQKHGYSRSETERMPKSVAKQTIDALVQNGWKRPQEVA